MSQLPEPDRSRAPLAWVVAIAAFVGYLVAARGPSNLFPLSVFDMYQGHAPAVVARLLVIDAVPRRRAGTAVADGQGRLLPGHIVILLVCVVAAWVLAPFGWSASLP